MKRGTAIGISAYRHIGTSFLAAILIFTSCYQRTYVPARTRDFSIATTKDRVHPLPSYVVYNVNDSVSRLYYKVKSTDLLFERSNVTNDLVANFKIEYTLRPVDAPKSFSDSGYVIASNVQQTVGEYIYGFTDFDVSVDGEYFLDVVLRDINKMSTTYDMIYVSHVNTDSPNNFLLTEPESETPLYRNVVSETKSFSLRHKDPNVTKLFVTYFKNTAEAARPPYALPVPTLAVEPDSSWTIDLTQQRSMQLPKEGYYRFTTTAESKQGFYICRFMEDYPKVTTPLALLEPLRYITTKKEYVTLQTSAKMKVSIDSFWIATGGSTERARELISAYYGRVEIVNTHFSTWKEGWKTDRGMVYIIYGEPQNVYRTPTSETWVYGQDQSGNTLNFVFNRNMTSGFGNDFELERNSVYNVSWITAVDFWKQGQVYRAR